MKIGESDHSPQQMEPPSPRPVRSARRGLGAMSSAGIPPLLALSDAVPVSPASSPEPFPRHPRTLAALPTPPASATQLDFSKLSMRDAPLSDAVEVAVAPRPRKPWALVADRDRVSDDAAESDSDLSLIRWPHSPSLDSVSTAADPSSDEHSAFLSLISLPGELLALHILPLLSFPDICTARRVSKKFYSVGGDALVTKFRDERWQLIVEARPQQSKARAPAITMALSRVTGNVWHFHPVDGFDDEHEAVFSPSWGKFAARAEWRYWLAGPGPNRTRVTSRKIPMSFDHSIHYESSGTDSSWSLSLRSHPPVTLRHFPAGRDYILLHAFRDRRTPPGPHASPSVQHGSGGVFSEWVDGGWREAGETAMSFVGVRCGPSFAFRPFLKNPGAGMSGGSVYSDQEERLFRELTGQISEQEEHGMLSSRAAVVWLARAAAGDIRNEVPQLLLGRRRSFETWLHSVAAMLSDQGMAPERAWEIVEAGFPLSRRWDDCLETFDSLTARAMWILDNRAM